MATNKLVSKIVPLTPQWLDTVYAIELKSYTSPWSRQSLEFALSGGYPAVGMVQKRELMGYLIYRRVLDELHILNIAVNPDYRKQGVGKQLLEWLHAHEKITGAKICYLEVGRNNQAARKLYDKLGYTQMSTRKAYYHDTAEDALILAKKL